MEPSRRIKTFELLLGCNICRMVLTYALSISVASATRARANSERRWRLPRDPIQWPVQRVRRLRLPTRVKETCAKSACAFQ